MLRPNTDTIYPFCFQVLWHFGDKSNLLAVVLLGLQPLPCLAHLPVLHQAQGDPTLVQPYVQMLRALLISILEEDYYNVDPGDYILLYMLSESLGPGALFAILAQARIDEILKRDLII